MSLKVVFLFQSFQNLTVYPRQLNGSVFTAQFLCLTLIGLFIVINWVLMSSFHFWVSWFSLYIFTVVVVYLKNKEDFRFQFSITTKLSNSMDIHNHGSQEKLSINYFSLFTCKLVFLKQSLVDIKIQKRFHCVDINANHCIRPRRMLVRVFLQRVVSWLPLVRWERFISTLYSTFHLHHSIREKSQKIL